MTPKETRRHRRVRPPKMQRKGMWKVMNGTKTRKEMRKETMMRKRKRMEKEMKKTRSRRRNIHQTSNGLLHLPLGRLHHLLRL